MLRKVEVAARVPIPGADLVAQASGRHAARERLGAALHLLDALAQLRIALVGPQARVLGGVLGPEQGGFLGAERRLVHPRRHVGAVRVRRRGDRERERKGD